ncbi:hypothetical protein NL50_09050 [Clostridium acetobutylicum]|nr:hypothetical protein NL50_09050 [Clostridium acetobutylicum]
MQKQVNIILTGLNGYGGNFVREILTKNSSKYKLIAVISSNPKKSEHYSSLLKHGVKIYSNIEACLKENKVDLAIITTPMHVHYKEVICALKHGVNVFCEKPLAPTIDECLKIKELSEDKNLFVGIGFQWSYSKAIKNLKSDILSNKFGKILKMKTMITWSRPKSYFENSTWKGRNLDANGNFILECLMSNSASHYLHNLLFLNGTDINKSSYPIFIEGEGYKAHKIDGYDTAFIRINTDNNSELLYLATVASKNEKKPVFEIQLENAIVYYDANQTDNIIVKTKNGEISNYGSPEEGRFYDWLSAIDLIKDGKKLICDISTTLPEVIAANAAIENIPAVPFDRRLVEENEKSIWIKDINKILEHCFKSEMLPSEVPYKWAFKAKRADISGYKSFSSIAKL